MRFKFITLMSLIILCFQTNVYGQDGADIMIMVLPDDSDDISLAAGSAVSKAISTKIKEQFHRYNYYVIPMEQLAADSDLGFNFSKRMSTSTLLSLANSAKLSGKPEFDMRAVVIYKVYPQVKELDYAKLLTIEISGEVHDVDAKRYLGDFGPIIKKFPVPGDCDSKACISGATRKKAGDIAAMVADEARKKLALLTKSDDVNSTNTGLTNTFAIRLENFSLRQALKVKGIMETEFPNFVRAGKLQGSEPIINFGYISKAPQGKILEWLFIVMDDMELSKVTKISADQNNFIIQKFGSDIKKKEVENNDKFN
jgi:hypothetical protein